MATQKMTLKELLLTHTPPYDALYDVAKMVRANYLGLLLNQKIEEKEKENPDEKRLEAIEEERNRCLEETKKMPDTVEGLIDMLDKYGTLVKAFKGIEAAESE